MTHFPTVFLVLLLIGGTQLVHPSSIRKHKAVDEITSSDNTGRDTSIESNVAGFEMIEEYLQKHINSEETEANMNAVKDLLIEHKSKPLGDFDQQFLAALEMFVNLEKLTQDTTCNRYGYDFLVKLKTAAKYRVDRRTTKRRRFFMPLRRIELMMSRFALIHAQKCQVIYQYNFARLFSEYNRSKLHSMDAFIDVMIDDRVKQNTRTDTDLSNGKAKLSRAYANLIDKNDSLKRPEDAGLLFNFMMSKTVDQFANSPRDELKEQLRTWFRAHLIEPCEDYLNTMAKDVFMPAELDTRIMDKADKIKPASDELRDGFIFGWVRYGLCRVLERDQHILMKNVMSLLDSQQTERQN